MIWASMRTYKQYSFYHMIFKARKFWSKGKESKSGKEEEERYLLCLSVEPYKDGGRKRAISWEDYREGGVFGESQAFVL